MEKFKILLLLLVFTTGRSIAQNSNYLLKGKIGTLNAPAKAYLIYMSNDKQVMDSIYLANGLFQFSGHINEPKESVLIISHDGASLKKIIDHDMLRFYLDAGTIEVKSSDSVANARITGSAINDDYAKLQIEMRTVNQKSAALNKIFRTSSPEDRKSPAFQEEIQTKATIIAKERDSIFLQYIKHNPQSLVSLNSLKQYAGVSPDAKEIQPLFNSLSKNIRESESGKAFSNYLSGLNKAVLGGVAPDFVQADTAGKMIKLSSFKGKYVLLDFWASWCAPCRLENPNLVKAYRNYHNKGFEILGVSLEHPMAKEQWMNAIHTDGLTWTQVSELNFWNNTAAHLYNVTEIPNNFLIDPTGKIIAENLRGKELEDKLSQLIDH